MDFVNYQYFFGLKQSLYIQNVFIKIAQQVATSNSLVHHKSFGHVQVYLCSFFQCQKQLYVLEKKNEISRIHIFINH